MPEINNLLKWGFFLVYGLVLGTSDMIGWFYFFEVVLTCILWLENIAEEVV